MPSYHGTNVNISYEITSIWHRWSNDEKQMFTFSVVPQLNLSNSSKINTSGSNNKGVRIILNLEDQSYKRAGSITGLARVTDPNDKIRSLSFLLIGTEKTFAQGQSEFIIKEHKQSLDLVKERDINIDLKIPADIPFSYVGKLSEYSYVVDLKADIAFAADVHAKENVFIY